MYRITVVGTCTLEHTGSDYANHLKINREEEHQQGYMYREQRPGSRYWMEKYIPPPPKIIFFPSLPSRNGTLIALFSPLLHS
jgi:hypothetical protein